MAVELGFLLSFAVVGRMVALSEQNSSDPSGAVTGSAVYAAVVATTIALGVPLRPTTAAAVTLALAAAMAVSEASRPVLKVRLWRARWSRSWLLATVSVLGIATVASPFRLVRDSGDSGSYLSLGARIAEGSLQMADVPDKRRVAFPALEAIGFVSGDVVTVGLLPALGAAGLMSVYAIVRAYGSREVSDVESGSVVPWAAFVASAIVLTNPQFLVHVVLIGPHLVVAFWLLLLAAVAADPSRASGAGRSLVVFSLAIALTAARPEGAILVALAMAPALASTSCDVRIRSHDLRFAGLAIVLWQVPHRTDGLESLPGAEGLALIALGVLLLLLSPSSVLRRIRRLPVVALGLAGAWVAFVAAFVLDPGRMARSLIATAANVALDVGGWGVSLLLLTVIALTARAVVGGRFPLRSGLLLGAFLPVHFVIVFLTGSAYRIGQSDSLNRMLFHLVPLLVVATTVAVIQGATELGEGRGVKLAGNEGAAGSDMDEA